MFVRRYNKLLSITAFSIFLSAPAFGGRILVNNDEWAFTNFGYAQAGHANADQLASNVAGFLTGGPGKILIYSSNFGVTESNFLASLQGAGYDYTLDKTGATSFDMTTLAEYKAIFFSGNRRDADDAVLTNYVNRGGGVFLALGAGAGEFPSSASEAAAWNPFLNNFGLTLGANYNLFTGTFASTGDHEVFDGVNNIYYNNGNTVSLTGTNEYASIVQTAPAPQGFGLFGIYDGPDVITPEPQTLTLLAAGLGLFAWMRRIRKAL